MIANALPRHVERNATAARGPQIFGFGLSSAEQAAQPSVTAALTFERLMQLEDIAGPFRWPKRLALLFF